MMVIVVMVIVVMVIVVVVMVVVMVEVHPHTNEIINILQVTSQRHLMSVHRVKTSSSCLAVAKCVCCDGAW